MAKRPWAQGETGARGEEAPLGRQRLDPTTKLCALLGAPVAHSGSPAMHNAAFAAVGRNACYLAFHVEDAAFPSAVGGLAALGAVGANVTVPHKERALAVAHAATERARRAGAANVLTFRDGQVMADNTDGDGFLRALGEAGITPHGRRLLVLGAGGAARAVIRTSLEAGAEGIVVVNRSVERAHSLARACDPEGRRVVPVALADAELGSLVARADVIINATSLGLEPDDPSPLPELAWSAVRRDAVAFDLVYAPHPTAFLIQARRRGLKALDGRRMLVWQAALSWECWFGELGPVDVMGAALDAWLAERGTRGSATAPATPAPNPCEGHR